MNPETAVLAENISKSFLIPHERRNTVLERIAHFRWKKNVELFKALKDVSFEIRKGEFFGIIGRNGSGKSTLLKILAGIYTPDKGKVAVNGQVSPFLELGVGFNPELSGRDNIYLNGTILGLTRKEIKSKFDGIVEFAGLERFVDQKLKNYSSGMYVRLAFSVAIHANRGILLMDEVLAVGDSNFQSKCLAEFNRYKNEGKTVILVSHDIETIRKYCDRAALLRDGEIVILGKAEEVCNEYMYQNMSDQEKELKKKAQELSEIINSAGIIQQVTFVNAHGEEINTVKTHDDLEIAISIYPEKVRDKMLNLEISLESEEGVSLFSYNTVTDDFRIDPGKDRLALLLKNLLLIKGNYSVSVAIHDRNDNALLDYKPKIKNIAVFPTGKEMNYKGYITLDHSWVQ